MTAGVVWIGAKALEPFLVPISELEPFKGNPRRGDLQALRESLRRWGQVRPILTDAKNARRIVAGHHIALAAEEEEWTHIAALANEFETDEEARDYLLADNRLHDLGRYEDDQLLEQLKAAEKRTGTGYSDEYVAELDRKLRAQFEPAATPPPRLDERVADPAPKPFNVPLWVQSEDDRRDFANHVQILKSEWGLDDTTAVVLRAVREKAAEANS